MGNLTSLKGKTAIITGSSRGIGKEIAKILIQHGANVVINSRKEEAVHSIVDELQTLDNRVLGIHVNDELDRLLENAEKINKEGLYTLSLPTLDGLH